MAADFFNWQTLGTLAAASGAVVAVSNTIRRLTRLAGPTVPFVISLAITFAGAAQTSSLAKWSDWVLTFLNSCLLFCTATGAQEALVVGAEGAAPKPLTPHGAPPAKWLSSWLRDMPPPSLREDDNADQ
ncbi:MAG: hypothetical protein QOF72_3107 [Blastocatellia bacterium]|jgi:hypothetical protein|nr:hypothetical protein [Blastocatellia bacterium]